MATQTINKVEEEEKNAAAKKDSGSADDFFQSDNNSGIDSWVSHMKSPREKIEEPELDLPEEEEANAGAGRGESDEEILNYFDYTEGHYKTAEFLLIQLDKFFAFSFSLISGMETERYRLRKEKPKGDDYEAEIAAALLKKYQMELPLEWMLVSALAISYGPGLRQAFVDRKAMKEAARKSEKG